MIVNMIYAVASQILNFRLKCFKLKFKTKENNWSDITLDPHNLALDRSQQLNCRAPQIIRVFIF
jgi:hypothetical protein